MSELNDKELLEFVCRKDQTLLDELETHRSGDTHRLVRRLDAVFKDYLSCSQQWTVPQIRVLLEALVKCYICTADSIKISRAVEKVWQPFLANHGEYINHCLESHVTLVFNSQQIDSNQIAKVSVLLEQNKLVQEIFHKHFEKVISWLSSELSTLLTLSPNTLTPTQAKCLYALVKISLQLFQVCAEELGTRIWEEGDNKAARNHSVKLTVESLVCILQTEGYHTDCVLLSGTATALMLNCCRNVDRAVKSFHLLLHQVLCSDSALKVELFDESLESSVIQQKVTHVLTRLNSLTSSKLGPVALIRGMVSCCNTDILFAEGPGTADRSPLLFQQIFQYIHILCQGDITLHYQAFQILFLWYTRLTKIPSRLESKILMSQFSSSLESTLTLVMLNWDSPVEDVPEATVDIFSCMMSVWEMVKDTMTDFPNKILKTLLKTQWYVKGKYRILASLLKVVDAQKVLEENSEIQAQLLQCLTTNHLASSATNVYKAFLQQLSRNKTAIEEWKTLWLPTLVKGLISDNSSIVKKTCSLLSHSRVCFLEKPVLVSYKEVRLLRQNTSLHWIPVTLKHFPLTSAVIQDNLSLLMEDPKTPVSRLRLLHAWIIVAKTRRTLTGNADLEHVNLREALCCADEDVRSDAIALVCTTLKKAECISKTEVCLLMECLPYNIKLDSAPFRQHLGSDIRKLLVRLRDSSVTMVKSSTQNKDKLDCALDFVDWLHKLCIDFLLPGACYQRRKGSLDLLHVLYESLIYCSDSKQRKGFVPESTTVLLDFAQSSQRWNFFSPVNTQALILCLLDGADEIQTSAYLLLTKYYTMPVDDNLKTSDSLCCHLLAKGLNLCNSPKGHEGQSGATLCKLVFQKYVMESKICFSINSKPDRGGFDVSTSKDTIDNSTVEFLTLLLTEANGCLSEAEKDLVKASKQYPIHGKPGLMLRPISVKACGLISAVTQCLTDVDDLWLTPSSDLVKVSEELVELCQQIIVKMLNIMAGVAGQEACPSFAEIGMALENLLLENHSDYEESTSLSPEYQYMLSWCWNNIKESCVSLSEVTRVTAMSGCPVSVSVIQSINTTFHTVLTKCRHKGVIEGCRSAFIKFCSALFHSNIEAVLSVPANSLTEVLSSLKNRSILSSVTRRSAGLPIIIQAVLVSEKKMKKTSLLSQAVTSLFEICELPLDKDIGVTDLPQVHGLNILNSLFSDASLTASLIGHTSHAVILVIQQFGSPSWAIRNAATRFFSTLVTRIFGQKKSQGEKFCNSVTFQEFSSYYPELPPFMLNILEEASTRNIGDISQIHPGLFPVLTLLSSLKAMDTKEEVVIRQLKRFFTLVEPFTGSPVYQLRHLVASALVAMVTVQEMTSSVTWCLQEHVTAMSLSSSVCYNSLHGYLSFIVGHLDYIERVEDLEKLWTLMTQEIWLITLNTGLVSSVYVKILHHILMDCPTVMVDEILEIVTLEHCVKGSKQIIGNNVFCEAAVEFLFESYNRNKICIYGLVDKLLTFNNAEARKTCLEKLPKFLEKSGKNQQYNKMAVMAILCSCVKKEKQFLQTVLNLICTLYQDIRTIHRDDLQNLMDWFTSANYEELKSKDSVLVSVLPVQAILLRNEMEAASDGNVKADLPEFCEVIHRFSRAVNESQRLTAVRALQISGKHLLDFAASATNQKWLPSLLEASLALVQDEDTEIRQEMCNYLSCLQWEGKPTQFSSYHSNICFELFLQYLSDKFWQCSQCVQFLYDQLTSPVSIQTLLEERASSRYQQLYDQEDNSFFAEKIYNAFDIHRNLKIMLKKCLYEKTDVPSELIKSVSLKHMEDQLEYLSSVLKSVPRDSCINLCSDNTVLSSICTLLLTNDIVAMVTNNRKVMEATVTIVKNTALPPALRQRFEVL